MKTPLILLLSIILIGLLGLASCAMTPGQKDQLMRAANVALAAGEMSGKVSPAQAAMVRKHGTLILAAGDDREAVLAALGNAAVDVAVERGALSQAEADRLRAAGQVPLAPGPIGAPEMTLSK